MSERLVHQRIGGVALQGISTAGEQTCIIAPELNVAFDFGKAPRELIPIDHVCLSHGHMDHAAGVAYYFSQRGFLGNSPGTVYVPASLADPLERLMAAWACIEGHPSDHNIVPLDPGQDVAIRRDLLIRPFAVNHRTAALGFAVVEVRHKLREEFIGKTGPELVALKKQGIEIQRRNEVAVLTYCGDTAEGDFLDLPHVSQAKVLILECTFVAPDHVHRARAGHHIHVRDLSRILARLKNEHIVLAHLTRRSFMREAKTAVRTLLKSTDLDRITFLMDTEKTRRRPNHAPQTQPRRDRQGA